MEAMRTLLGLRRPRAHGVLPTDIDHGAFSGSQYSLGGRCVACTTVQRLFSCLSLRAHTVHDGRKQQYSRSTRLLVLPLCGLTLSVPFGSDGRCSLRPLWTLRVFQAQCAAAALLLWVGQRSHCICIHSETSAAAPIRRTSISSKSSCRLGWHRSDGLPRALRAYGIQH